METSLQEFIDNLGLDDYAELLAVVVLMHGAEPIVARTTRELETDSTGAGEPTTTAFVWNREDYFWQDGEWCGSGGYPLNMDRKTGEPERLPQLSLSMQAVVKAAALASETAANALLAARGF